MGPLEVVEVLDALAADKVSGHNLPLPPPFTHECGRRA